MFEAPERKDWEYLQAVTWFDLAADRGIAEAKRIVEEEFPKLTAEQVEWVGKLKGQLAEKPFSRFFLAPAPRRIAA